VPCIVKYNTSKPSTIQIASSTKIWIIDILPSSNSDASEIVKLFINTVLTNPNIQILGHGLKGDITKLKSQFSLENTNTVKTNFD
jgi:ribonuclease D